MFVKDELKVTDDVEFELQNSWINRHSANEQNTLHWHSNAMISGVYYIQNEPGAGDIVFQKITSLLQLISRYCKSISKNLHNIIQTNFTYHLSLAT